MLKFVKKQCLNCSNNMMYPSFKQQLATQQEGTILHSKTTRKSSPSQSMMYLYLKPNFGLVSNLLSAPPSIIDFNLDNLTLKTKFFCGFSRYLTLFQHTTQTLAQAWWWCHLLKQDVVVALVVGFAHFKIDLPSRYIHMAIYRILSLHPPMIQQS